MAFLGRPPPRFWALCPTIGAAKKQTKKPPPQKTQRFPYTPCPFSHPFPCLGTWAPRISLQSCRCSLLSHSYSHLPLWICVAGGGCCMPTRRHLSLRRGHSCAQEVPQYWNLARGRAHVTGDNAGATEASRLAHACSNVQRGWVGEESAVPSPPPPPRHPKGRKDQERRIKCFFFCGQHRGFAPPLRHQTTVSSKFTTKMAGFGPQPWSPGLAQAGIHSSSFFSPVPSFDLRLPFP